MIIIMVVLFLGASSPTSSPSSSSSKNDVIEELVVKKGVLKKKKRHSSIFSLNNWQLRYFVLELGSLAYYNSEDDAKIGTAKGVFSLNRATLIGSTKGKLHLKFFMPNLPDLELEAANGEDTEIWEDCIKKHIEFANKDILL